MAEFVVAYYVPHNEGVESGIITNAHFDSGIDLVDLYEVDAIIKSFFTLAEATEWLNARLAETAWEDENG